MTEFDFELPTQAPVLGINTPPDSPLPQFNRQLGNTFNAKRMAAARHRVISYLRGEAVGKHRPDEIREYVGRLPTPDEIDDMTIALGEVFHNAHRPDSKARPRWATGTYVWLESELAVIGVGDTEVRTKVDDGRVGVEHGMGSDILRALAHAVLIRPVTLEAAKRKDYRRTQKIYQAVFVLGTGLSREECITAATMYADRQRTPKGV